jgi:hypothetical protein
MIHTEQIGIKQASDSLSVKLIYINYFENIKEKILKSSLIQ